MTADKKATVLIVDDSLIFRKAMEQALNRIPFVKVIGSAFNGIKALEFLREKGIPDIITLDVEMPSMDGIATLREIMKIRREQSGGNRPEVIMVSTLTHSGASVTIDALQNGAFDFITKPEGTDTAESQERLYELLKEKIFSIINKEKAPGEHSPLLKTPARYGISSFDAVLIGVSTGGPRALADLLPALSEATDLPAVIVQHMPPSFTLGLADNLNKRVIRGTVKEAKEQDRLLKNHYYIAQGGRHLIFREDAAGPYLAYNDSPPENGSRPSVDVLFRSAAGILRSHAIALILTGMGSDGVQGLKALKRAGSYVIAQDEQSSVVWGMPGSAVQAETVDEILPLMDIPEKIRQILNRN